MPFGVLAICLAPFAIFYSKGMKTPSRMRHEGKHWQDQWRLWLIGFYVAYLYEYFKLRFAGFGHYEAYMSISFEVEARAEE
jgi:hypothetical protein